MSKPIRVLITDDHTILREGLISMLEKQDNVEIVGQAENVEQCLARTEALHPDVIVMDIKMTGASGIDACLRIKSDHPETKVIILSMYDDFEYVDRALRAGADGYLLKRDIGADLAEAIQKAANGEPVFSPPVLEMIVGLFKGDTGVAGEPSPLGSLTPRELEVLKLASDGLRIKQIAAHLYLAPKTVEKVISSIYRKLGVNSRVAATRIFIRDFQ